MSSDDTTTFRRTCADVAAVGVHPVAVQALADLQSSLVRVTTVPPPTPSATTSQSAALSDIPPSTTPTSDCYSSRGLQQQHDPSATTLPSHHSISLADRATHFITSEFICRVSFEDLFVGAVNTQGASPRLPPSRRLSTMQDPAITSARSSMRKSIIVNPPTTTTTSTEADDGTTPTPTDVAVVDAHGRAFDDGFRCIGGNSELEVDDMLWVVDNRKLTPEQRKAWQEYLLAEQESYEKQYQERRHQQLQPHHGGHHHHHKGGHMVAPWPPPPPPPSSSVPRDMVNSDSANGGFASSSPSTNTATSGIGAANEGTSTLRHLNITLGAASTKQLSLLRRGVEATAQYLNAADQEERDFQAEVQEIKEDEVRRYCDRQVREMEERTAAKSNSELDDEGRPLGGQKRQQQLQGSSSSTSPSSPANTPPLAPKDGEDTSPTTSATPTPTKEGGFFARFKLDSNSKNSDAKSSSGGGDNNNNGGGLGGKLLSVLGNLTKKATPKDENGNPLTQAAIDEIAIRKQLLMLCPPICWRETLGLNIVTQWTYTLTIAVVKYCVVYRDASTNVVVDRSRAKEARKRLGPGGQAAAVTAGLPAATTTPSDQPQTAAPAAADVASASPGTLGVNRSKELVVVRHVSRRVYGQPTKAQFHTKDHRSATGDTIDYPNIYFNIDDFDDDARFQDIKLCDGYTLAVLLTAGASRNSSAAIFRGALSYDIIMQRMKRHSKLFMGGTDGGGNSRQGSSASLGGSSLFDGAGAGPGDAPKLFIPLIGPEKKGKAEMSVSIGEAERELSRQHQLYEQRQKSEGLTNSSSSGSFGGESSTSSPSMFDSFASKNNGSESGSFFNKIVGSKSGGGIVGDSGGGSSSLFSRQPTSEDVPVTLQGNEAIQCSLTFVSVHAQHVMDALTNTEQERNRQWLTFPTSDEELTKILEMSSSA